VNSIYLTCKMNMRRTPSLKGEVIEVKERNQIIPVLDITEEIDGYVWFHVPGGYIANVEEVFLHAERYETGDNEKIRSFISDVLDSSLKATSKTVNEIKKALDKF